MFFKKKRQENINSKYKINEAVRFKYHNEMFIGNVSKIYKLDDVIYYDILVGGECAFEARKIHEDQLNAYKTFY